MASDDNQTASGSRDSPPVNLLDFPSPEACVICLDRISEKAIALPCKHDQFDFPCLGTWLQEQRFCPLCKATVKSIQYDLSADGNGTLFHLPPSEETSSRPTSEWNNITRSLRLPSGTHDISHHGDIPSRRLRSDRGSPRHWPRHRGTNFPRPPPPPPSSPLSLPPNAPNSPPRNDPALAFRRTIYRNNLYSLHVGSNRISGYRTLSPPTIAQSPHEISRARTFIRRELAVFDFLDPSSSSFGHADRRATNAEFLLEYVVAILKSIELRGSAGQAEELLKDFLGRENARLFLHELEAWLRSPFERLEEWDRNVQYPGIGAAEIGGRVAERSSEDKQ